MLFKIQCLATLSFPLFFLGCGAADDAPLERLPDYAVKTSSASLATSVTSTTRVTFVCNETTAFAFLIDVQAPATVRPSESFAVSLRVRDFFIFPAPFAGTLSASQNLLASSATPAAAAIALPVLHFPAGQPILDLGSGTATLSAASAAGSPVVLDAGNFDYAIVPDDPINNGIAANCVPADPVPATLAVIPIVQTPSSKGDCKHGAWRLLTDDAGKAFRNQGACMKYASR